MMQRVNSSSSKDDTMYGISRIDCDRNNTHAWRVSLVRRGTRHVKNFADKKLGGKMVALQQAIRHRDKLLRQQPPITRREFCDAKRRNNKTGITGVYKYRKTYKLKDGTQKESWYWEANWPGPDGDSISKAFPVKRYGEDLAKQMATRAREQGLRSVTGVYWAAERGSVDNQDLQHPAEETRLSA
jgi:hypothetical protein